MVNVSIFMINIISTYISFSKRVLSHKPLGSMQFTFLVYYYCLHDET